MKQHQTFLEVLFLKARARYLRYNSLFVYYLLRDLPLGPSAPGRIE